MTVQDVERPGDFTLKDGSRVSVEHRTFGESPKEVMLLQVLIKTQLALYDASRPENIAKFGNNAAFIVDTKIQDKKYVEFLKFHQITYSFGDKPNKENYIYLDLAKNNQIAIMNDVLSLIKEAAELFVRELKSDKIKLDYSISSVPLVDNWVLAQRQKGFVNKDIATTAGCYWGDNDSPIWR
jgi:hypothetical protein